MSARTRGDRRSGDGAPVTAEPAMAEVDDDRPIDWKAYGPEDVITFVLFWVLAGIVFLQFFTRYVLNDSLGWTEEIARYFLIGVCFVGSAIAVRHDSHIFVEFFYRFIPLRAARFLAFVIDVGRIAFLGYATFIAIDLAQRTNQTMTSIAVSKALVYWVVAAGLAAMTVRAVQLAWRHLKGDGGKLVRVRLDRSGGGPPMAD